MAQPVREIAAKTNPDSPGLAARKPTACSRVSNGHDLLPNIDGRSIIARRYRDISFAILVDQGGENVSESRKQLIRRFAAAAVLAEQLEAKLANGQEIDIAQHALLCSTLTRLSQRIGLNRVAKDISLTLADLIQQDQERQRRETEKVPEAVP
jgi:hypothetical protein